MSETTTGTASGPSPQEHILGMTIAHWHSRALAAAAELELADHLADGPLSVDALASRAGAHASSLFRLMRALESIGIFQQVSLGVFANTSLSERLLKSVAGSMWAWVRCLLSSGGGFFEGRAGLTDSVRTGKPAFDERYGYNWIEFLRRKPDLGAIFNEAMRSVTGGMTAPITASYDWSLFPVIADIGGGIGTQLVDILDAHASCRGILFDLPHVIAQAIPHDRIERVTGNFFECVPSGADAYILRVVIHDWDDPEAAAILRSVRQAARQDSRLAVIRLYHSRNTGKYLRQVVRPQHARQCRRPRAHCRRMARFAGISRFRFGADRSYSNPAEHRDREAS